MPPRAPAAGAPPPRRSAQLRQQCTRRTAEAASCALGAGWSPHARAAVMRCCGLLEPLLLCLATTAARTVVSIPDSNATLISATAPWYRFDGVGGLSGGGATSTFLMAYDDPIRSEIMDWMFKPGFAGSLDILKVEIGCDDETTDGCESCHMRSPTEVNCSRGYEWDLMKAAVERNPAITL